MNKVVKTNQLIEHKKQFSNENETILRSTIDAYLVELSNNESPEDNLNVLQQLSQLIVTSTGFASIPLTLKIMEKHYETFKSIYDHKRDVQVKMELANLISFVATSHRAPNSKGDVLKYYQLSLKQVVDSWGIAYVRDLVNDIVEQWKSASDDDRLSLIPLISRCASYFLQQNSELEACDLLMETEQMEHLLLIVDNVTICTKVCHYVTACCTYLPQPNNKNILYTICCKWPKVVSLLSNEDLHQTFIDVCRQLELNLQPQTLDNILKRHSSGRQCHSQLNQTIPSIDQILINSFINMAFGYDQSLTQLSICNNEIIEPFLHSKVDSIKAGALLAMGLANCTIHSLKYEPKQILLDHLLASNVCNEIQLGTLMALSFAYAAKRRADVVEPILKNIVTNEKSNSYNIGLGSITCGIIYIGHIDGHLIGTLIETIVDRYPKLSFKVTRNIIHSIGLCCMGKDSMMETINGTIDQVFKDNDQLKSYFTLFIEICSLVGSSNILMIQELLNNCRCSIIESKSKVKERNKKVINRNESNDDDNNHFIRTISIIGIGMLSLGDEVNIHMIMREFILMLRNGDRQTKNAVILTIALVHLSNPKLSVIDTLCKFTHSTETAINAIIALGLIGAGTGNGKIGKVLYELINFYRGSNTCRWAINISFGLLYLGNCSLTLNPQMEGCRLIRHQSICGVLIFILHLLDQSYSSRASFATLLHNQTHILLYLTLAIRPKMLVTYDHETMKPIPIQVRVGQPIDITGQAGIMPRSVTAFNTYQTPVLISTNEKAELDNDNFIPLNPYMEGHVLVKRISNNNNSNNVVTDVVKSQMVVMDKTKIEHRIKEKV
ncbi:26S proteasome non-ATPase regulatory subunit 2 [Blomia tropicalis]|nr:26S proteasome non-ATPase regulatory subunit 2 [Blomia tropicalis]